MSEEEIPTSIPMGRILGRFSRHRATDGNLLAPHNGVATITPSVEVLGWPNTEPPTVLVRGPMRCPIIGGQLFPEGTDPDTPADDLPAPGVVVPASVQVNAVPYQIIEYGVRVTLDHMGVSPLRFRVSVPADGTTHIGLDSESFPPPGPVVVVDSETRRAAEAARDAAAEHRQAAASSHGGALEAEMRINATERTVDSHADRAEDARDEATVQAEVAGGHASAAEDALSEGIAARDTAREHSLAADASRVQAAVHVSEAAEQVSLAAGQVSLAADQVGLAASHANRAEDARDEATVQAEVAGGHASAAEASRQGAVTARTAAEAARDTATTAATTATGAASTATSQAAAATASAQAAASSAASAATTAIAGGFHWDAASGRYTNESIQATLAAGKRPLVYGVSIPKGLATACEKTGANAGLATPVPGVAGVPAIDPYAQIGGPFFYVEVNGGVEPDGTPYVTAVSGDANFRRDGSNGDVWILAPVLFWRFTESDNTVDLEVSDTRLAGFDPQPKAIMPGGKLRPYMLYAKYGLSIVGGVARSVSGATLAIRNVSHNSLIAQCKNATTGYSGKSFADDWYVKIMFLLKYATKNSQSIFAGCTSHDVRGLVYIAETETNRVIIPNPAAANFPIGSSVSLGTNNPPSMDRANAKVYDVFDMRTVLAKEAYDGANVAVTVNGPPFTTDVGYHLSSMPWNPGGCDAVIGDGSPSNPLSGREPFVIQGIETGLGAYETLGDVIISNTGTGWVPMLLADSKLAATAATPNYADPGARLPATEGAWAYTLHPANAAGLLFGDKTGGSSTTGMADGSYTSAIVSLGTRQWRGLGDLPYGGRAGLWCVSATYALGSGDWSIGSRLSGVGRSAG